MSRPGPATAAEPRLPAAVLAGVDAALRPVDERRRRSYPGDGTARQPVHTVYVPADAVTGGLAHSWGGAALAAQTEHAPDPGTMARVLDLDPALVGEIWPRVLDKLHREPIEDLRVDAEDGYRGTAEAEDDDVRAAAAALGADIRDGQAPPFVGLRPKCLEQGVRARGLRSLDLFLGALLDGAGDAAALQSTVVLITLPKVTDVAQVDAMVGVLAALETAYGLTPGRLGLELQVETPQAVLGADGRATLAPMLHAAGARVRGLHYGTYDYSASLGIAAAHQASDHPAADHAKATMQLAVAGTAANAVDGSTNILPVGSPDQVHAGWRLHARLVRRALERGFYQGWDLHPAQLLTRYVATYAFFAHAMPEAAGRLRAYTEQTAGQVMDEPATAKALASVLIRGLDCGALDDAEVAAAAGIERGALDRLAGRRP